MRRAMVVALLATCAACATLISGAARPAPALPDRAAVPTSDADTWCWPPVPDAIGYIVYHGWPGTRWMLVDHVEQADCVYESVFHGPQSCCTLSGLPWTGEGYPLGMLTVESYNSVAQTRDHGERALIGGTNP